MWYCLLPKLLECHFKETPTDHLYVLTVHWPREFTWERSKKGLKIKKMFKRFHLSPLWLLLFFTRKLLGGGGDLRMILCHSMNTGSVMAIPWGGGDTQTLPTLYKKICLNFLYWQVVGTQKLSLTNFCIVACWWAPIPWFRLRCPWMGSLSMHFGQTNNFVTKSTI